MSRRKRERESGQELVELGLVLLIFVGLVGLTMLGGYAFMITNLATHAARDGARLAASWNSRGPCGQITNSGPIETAVTDMIATVTTETFTATVSQIPSVSIATPPCAAVGATPKVAVNVQGCVPYLFNFFGWNDAPCPGGMMRINRTVTFDDELRATFGG